MSNHCHKCGCTETEPCITEAGACHWVIAPSANMAGVCSQCATAEDVACALLIAKARRGSWDRPVAPRYHRRYL